MGVNPRSARTAKQIWGGREERSSIGASLGITIDGRRVFVGTGYEPLVRFHLPKPPPALTTSCYVRGMARRPPSAIFGWTGLSIPRGSVDIGGECLCCEVLVEGRGGGEEGPPKT